MEINLFKNITNAVSKLNVSDFIKQLTERLNNMDKELVIDRIENDNAVCEDRKTKEIININLSELPEESKEGSVIKLENGKYIIDIEKEKEISDRIKNKMDNLWE